VQPNDPSEPQQRRGNLLALMMAALFGGGFLLFLIVASGGFFVYVLGVVAVMAAVGFLHYVLWGHSLTQQVAAEKEADELRERQEADREFTGDKIQSKRF
jgi:high-affinity Fe2+/Pb2+ permease